MSRPALRSFMRPCGWVLGIMVVTCFALFSSGAQAQGVTASGAVIRNTATVAYADGGGAPRTVVTNEVASLVQPAPTRSQIAILRAATGNAATVSETAGPTECRGANGFAVLSSPKLTGGTVIDATKPVALTSATDIHGGEPAFIQLTDPDQNVDATVIDAIQLRVASAAGDVEILRLSETGPNTGVFVGYIQTSVGAPVAGNCVLEVDRNAEISASYIDTHDAQDTSAATALVDPYGQVFDSRSGAPINGVRVRLVNAATGQLATVYGDDGVSTYPSEVVTGAQSTDSGGTVYALPPGVFRFPLVVPADYRIEIVAPSGHAFPSAATIAQLATIVGAPFHLNDGSFGRAFTASAPPAVAIDIPLDPLASQLYLQKSTTTTVAAVGDFIQYTLTAQNVASQGTFPSLQVVDRLPNGVRYRKGSVRINQHTAAEPMIAADGQTLTFATGALLAGQSLTITYVAEVTVAATGRQLVNTAQAISIDGTISNSATAAVQLKEELFRTRSFVMGRVVEGTCDKNINDQRGIPGVRVYLDNGDYSITDRDGKYHFENVTPGSHVVQLDELTIPGTHEPLLCEDRVRNAGRSYSQFVDLRAGALWRADFTLARRAPPAGSLDLSLNSVVQDDTIIAHHVSLKVAGNDVTNVRAMIVLPAGISYLASSARLDGAALEEPQVSDGVLTFRISALRAGSEHALQFSTNAREASAGGINIKALALFDSPAKPNLRTESVENRLVRGEMTYETESYRFSPHFDAGQAELKAEDRQQLDRVASQWQGVRNIHLSAVGHTDKTAISADGRTRYADNYALSKARAAAVAEYLSDKLGLTGQQLEIEGKGADEPLAKGNDPESLARNRRVEIAIAGTRVKAAGKLTVATGTANAPQVATEGTLSLAQNTNTAAVAAPAQNQAGFDIEKLAPGILWLSPQEDDLQQITSIKVAIEHGVDQKVELLVNERAVNKLSFDGVETNKANTVGVSHWRGIRILEGNNKLVAIVRNADGAEAARMERAVRFGGGAVRGEFVKESSVLMADGKTHPVIALRMFDADGKPARPGTLGTYRIDAPYRAWSEVKALDENKLLALAEREPTFAVDADGLARLELEPTTQAGNAVVHLRFNERQSQDIRAWLQPQARDWVLVGIAEGTAAYKTISDNMQGAQADGIEEGLSENGRAAFFAKGAIKGEYLLTLAYDSARDYETEKQRLLGVIEPSRYYTLYGDGTEQRSEAPTSRKLYLKLERAQFAALFGDFQTGLTVTELSRYSRTVNGFKSDYAGDRFGYSAFATQSDQGYVKDELPGDGTSGLYRLSRRPIIINSDKVRIETHDRFRSEVVVETQTLTRFIDYTIDYQNGTIFFKQPVMSRDANFNPNLIVAEYEVSNGGKEEVTAGGRGAVKLAGDKVELGASFIQQGSGNGDTRLGGADLRWRVAPATEVKAEVARTENQDPTLPESADAYLTEITHVGEHLDVRGYLREQQTGFGVGQQLTTELGTRKVGADGTYRLGDQWSARGEAFRQEVLATGAQRDMASVEVRRQAEGYTLGAGLRHVADTGLTTGDATSELASLNGSVDLFDHLITLKAGQDVALSHSGESADYPARSTVGVDYHVTALTTVFADYEHGDGAALSTDMMRLGVRTSPWANARITSSVNDQATENGSRVFSQLGLTQGWQVNDRWALDFGLDRSSTLAGNDLAPLNTNVPLASGSLNGDFLATYIGALYRSEFWSATSRIERRTSDAENRWTLIGGFFREPKSGNAFSLSTQYFTSSAASGSDTSSGDVQLSWAYRPVKSEWIILDRLNFKRDALKDTLSDVDSSRIVNNLNANWQLNLRTQLGIQLAGRYVRSTFDDERYNGFSDLYGVDFRRDLTRRFDAGLHGALLHSWNAGVSTQSFGVDIGFTPARNVWISIGYNFDGFRDEDFEASRYTAQGPYLKFRVKADQDTFKDLSLDAFRPKH